MTHTVAAQIEEPTLEVLKSFLDTLPPINRAVLKELVSLGSEIIANVESTKVCTTSAIESCTLAD
jgi:hypothetical protein